jgi:hypothetical protein
MWPMKGHCLLRILEAWMCELFVISNATHYLVTKHNNPSWKLKVGQHNNLSWKARCPFFIHIKHGYDIFITKWKVMKFLGQLIKANGGSNTLCWLGTLLMKWRSKLMACN